MNATEVEQALLGALLSGYDDEALHVTADDFEDPHHAAVFSAVLAVQAKGQRVDMVRVNIALGRHRLPTDNATFLHGLMLACPSTLSAPWYAEQVADAADKRGLDIAGQRIREIAAGDKPAMEAIEDARALLDKAPRREASTGSTWDEIVPKVIDRIDKGITRGMSSPWPDLDRVLMGFAPGRLYIVAARPGQGKSVFGQNLAVHIARSGKGVYIASMEMSKDEYGTRIVADTASVPLSDLMENRLDELAWKRVGKAQDDLAGMPLLIEDDFSQSIAQIRRGARDYSRRQALGLLVVDYLQQIHARDQKVQRHEQVAEISRSLKALARELNVPVLALSQLNRASESRADRRPTSADLRESGAQEADADAVLLLHREDRESGELLVIPDKNRWGPQTVVTLHFWGHYARLASAAKPQWSPSGSIKPERSA